MGTIYLNSQTDGKPRRKLVVDEFSYTVTTVGGEATVTLPGSRSYTPNDHMTVYANGIKIKNAVEYDRGTNPTNTTITGVVNPMFPDGKFPKNCVLDFELFTTN
jgi:hypothetical protein